MWVLYIWFGGVLAILAVLLLLTPLIPQAWRIPHATAVSAAIFYCVYFHLVAFLSGCLIFLGLVAAVILQLASTLFPAAWVPGFATKIAGGVIGTTILVALRYLLVFAKAQAS